MLVTLDTGSLACSNLLLQSIHSQESKNIAWQRKKSEGQYEMFQLLINSGQTD